MCRKNMNADDAKRLTEKAYKGELQCVLQKIKESAKMGSYYITAHIEIERVIQDLRDLGYYVKNDPCTNNYKISWK